MMGPYIVCCSLLQQQLSFAGSIPWLLLYNIIIIIPMIIITLIIYFGFSTVDNVYGWREKNLRLMHLITGIILVLIGLALIFGWLY
jgi:cytochrome c biogenesis protein CcdA